MPKKKLNAKKNAASRQRAHEAVPPRKAGLTESGLELKKLKVKLPDSPAEREEILPLLKLQEEIRLLRLPWWRQPQMITSLAALMTAVGMASYNFRIERLEMEKITFANQKEELLREKKQVENERKQVENERNQLANWTQIRAARTPTDSYSACVAKCSEMHPELVSKFVQCLGEQCHP